MNMSNRVTVPMSVAAKQLQVEVTITGLRVFRFRWRIMMAFLRCAQFVSPCPMSITTTTPEGT